MVYIIIGSIGSGKSSVAKLLAQKLNYKYVELDELALAKTGFKSVDQALNLSPTKLKESELAVSKELSTQDNLVVVFGGSMVFNRLNFDYFKEAKHEVMTIYIETSLQQQVSRLLQNHPDLQSQESKIRENLKVLNEERAYLFQALSNKKISSTNLTPEQIVNEIISTSK